MRLLSIVEAATITGPVKPLLMFSKIARAGDAGQPPLEHSLLTTARPSRREALGANELLRAAHGDALEVDVVPERFAFDPAILGHMGRLVRARAPDLVETHDFKSHFLFWMLRRTGAVGDVGWIAFHHGYTRMSLRVRGYQQLDRLSLRHADVVVTLCRPFVEQLASRGVPRERIAVISNAVAPRAPPAPQQLESLRRSLGLAAEDRVILSVGRLSTEKGHADLLRAFRRLLEDASLGSLRLLLVGDGQQRARLTAEASDLAERVIFTGHRPDPWPYFCIGDLFVLPSHAEGSPLVLFEAMAAGLPIVATAVGGVPEVVESGSSALLVRPGEVGELARGISELLKDAAAAKALGAAGRERLARFSPQAYARRLLGIYRAVLAGQSSCCLPP